MKHILIAALVLALLPTAQAHRAPAVLDVEINILSDEASDASYTWDGYDITNVYVREAVYDDQDGIIVRVLASGGNSVGLASGAGMELTLTGNETKTFLWTTMDEETWAGELPVVEAIVTPDENLPVSELNLQVFVPLSELGIAWGDTLSDFRVTMYAGTDRVDTAPGGIFLADQDISALPAFSGGGVDEDLATDGPDGYTNTSVDIVDGELVFTVDNLITTAGQHIFFRLGEAPGWDLMMSGAMAVSAEPGTDPKFRFMMHDVGQGSIPFEVYSDLGGLEQHHLLIDGETATLTSTSMGGSVDEAPAETTPGPAIGLLVVGLAALALRRK